MPRWCEERVMEDGSRMILCHSGPRGKPCIVCGKPSTKLCDWVIDADGHTCDAPLCDKHGFHPLANGVPIFGEDKDYCPEHAPLAINKLEK